MRKILLATSTLSAVIAAAQSMVFASIGMAQEVRVEEIIVTARKREEKLQEVPLAITAFTAADMARRQLDSLRDVALQTAGFSFEDYASTALETPVVRGQTQTFLTNPVQNVSTFVDGVYLQRGYMIDVGLIDMERIEVLKGPQSALYGQNAFAGAISYITKKPTDEFEASATATIGTDKRYDAKGSVSGPIVREKLGVRLGGGLTKFDGSWENNHPLKDADVSPGTTGNVGGYDNWAINAAIVATPVDELSIEGGYYRSSVDAEIPAQYTLIGQRAIGQFRFSLVNDLNCSPTVQFGTLGNNLWCGALPSRPQDVPGAGVNRTAAEPVIDPRSYGQNGVNSVARGSIRYEISDALSAFYQYGHAKSDLTSGRQSVRDAIAGLPQGAVFGLGSGRILFDSVPNGALKSNSHETRLEYDGNGPFSALLGAYFYRSTDFASSRVYYLLPLQTAPLTEQRTLSPANFTILRDKSSAVFGSAQYVAGDWSFTGELRYSDEKKRRYTAPDPINNGPQFGRDIPALPTNPDLAPKSFDFVTPRFTVRYKPADEQMIYATAARGAKAGGFNRATILPEEQTYNPEFNWTYELGTKNQFLDGRLTLNAAAFYIDWSGLQVSGRETNAPATAPAIIRNLAGASTFGFEVEGGLQANDKLDFTWAFSYSNPKLDDGTIYLEAALGNWCSSGVCDPTGNIGGNNLPRTPKTKATVGAQWTDELTGSIEYYLRSDVSYQSKQYAELLNVGWVPSRTLVNASIGLSGEIWDVQLWAKNLFDEKYATSALFGGSFIYGVAFGDRRTIGLTASYNF